MKTSRFLWMGLMWVGVTALNMKQLPVRYGVAALVETVSLAPMHKIVRAVGTVEANRSLTIKAEFEGPVMRKFYKEGDNVKTGQLLLLLGRDKIKLLYDSKVIALDNAKSDLVKARADVKVQRTLFHKGAVARISVDDAERNVVHMQQALTTALEEFHQQENRWKQNKIFAPFDGTIVTDTLRDETAVAAGKDILTIADLSSYQVVAKVDEFEIGQVRVGQQARIELYATQGPAMPAHVSAIGGQAESNGLTEVTVILQLNGPPSAALRPKLTAVANILTGQLGEVVSVPIKSLMNAQNQTNVWVVSSSRRIQARPIIIGRSNPYRVEVKQGLRIGERIVSETTSQLVEGLKIRMKESPSETTHLPPALMERLRQMQEKRKVYGQ